MPLAVFMLASCQYTPEEEFRYVEQSFSLKTYKFPTQPIGALGVVQVELNVKRLSADSVSIRGSLAPQMDELAARYSDRGALEVISIDFLDADGAKLTQQGVTFERLVPATDGKYTFPLTPTSMRIDSTGSSRSKSGGVNCSMMQLRFIWKLIETNLCL